jgi:hypothetical protein
VPAAFLVLIELAGTFHVSIISSPFFLGSDDHKRAIKELPRPAAAPV